MANRDARLDKKKQETFGIQEYEIKQGVETGTLTVTFISVNPNGDCSAYAEFLNDLNALLREKYSPNHSL